MDNSNCVCVVNVSWSVFLLSLPLDLYHKIKVAIQLDLRELQLLTIRLLLIKITVRICPAYPEMLTELSLFHFLFRLIGGSDNKLIYRHYATLYFVFCVDSSESELGILDLIQVSFFCCFVFFLVFLILNNWKSTLKCLRT